MENRKLFGALRATTLAALCAGGLVLSGCNSQQEEMHHDGARGTMGGEASCGEASCGDKGCGESSCGEKPAGEHACGENSCG